MKKKLVILIVGIMGIMLVACTPNDNKDENAQKSAKESESTTLDVSEDAMYVETDKSEEEIYEGFGMANPWVDSDKEGVLEATGFDLAAPDNAVNVIYSYMPSTGMAQMNYNMENAMWVYRVQITDALEDISGIYCEWNYTGETKVDGMDAMEYSYASEPQGDYLDDMSYMRVINWYDSVNKVTHSLSVIGTDLNGMDIAVYAENLFKTK